MLHETHTVQTWERRRSLWILVREKWLRGEPMPDMAEPEPDKDKPARGSEPEPGPVEPEAVEPGPVEPADGGAPIRPDREP